MEPNRKSVIICGAGLVGSLNACFFAKRGWDVTMYEQREDPRTQKFVHGRSINLAASVRARTALAAVGLEDRVVSRGIPMHARYIHNKDGKTGFAFPYGKQNQYILSVNRRELNELMLTEAETCPSVKLFFNCKVLKCNPTQGEVLVQSQDDMSTKWMKADLIIGCDGAYSALRRSMLTYPGFNFSQYYIEHGYIELCMPPADNNQFALKPNFFHLWPRGKFTLIALANMDKTFTVTLFAPWKIFDKLHDDATVTEFFELNFPDALKLIGEKAVTETFSKVKASALLSVKCSPHHFGSKVLLMGDAAHAMVPFYGQGMNCGFEDCLILKEMLDKNDDDIGKAIEEYSQNRVIDAESICDLALYNYKELCYLVNSRKFRIRKKFDTILHSLIPSIWIPLYSSVTFSRMRYHKVIENRQWQDKTLRNALWVTLIGSLAMGGVHAFRSLVKQ